MLWEVFEKMSAFGWFKDCAVPLVSRDNYASAGLAPATPHGP